MLGRISGELSEARQKLANLLKEQDNSNRLYLIFPS